MAKTCFKCEVSKPLTEFYKHAQMADGHLNKCKTCTKSDVRKHREENDSVREYDRRRGSRQTKEDVQRYRADNPNKYAAHLYINNGLRSGRILKPDICEVCNSKPISKKALHGHHDDYAKPHVVRWLCARCHSTWHAKHGEALNAS